LRDVPVLVVGGGEVATRKVSALLAAHARVTVVAPVFDAALKRLGHTANVRQAKRVFRVADLDRQRLIFAATDNPALNARIARAAAKRGVWANVAAPGDTGSFQVPASVHRGQVCVAVSTNGASAALARTLRERIERRIGPEWGELAALLDERRERILKQVADPAERRALLQNLARPRWAATIRRHGAQHTAREMDRCIATVVRTARARAD
jgi:siroheme synthase-like protein